MRQLSSRKLFHFQKAIARRLTTTSLSLEGRQEVDRNVWDDALCVGRNDESCPKLRRYVAARSPGTHRPRTHLEDARQLGVAERIDNGLK